MFIFNNFSRALWQYKYNCKQIERWQQNKSMCFFTYIQLDFFYSHPSKWYNYEGRNLALSLTLLEPKVMCLSYRARPAFRSVWQDSILMAWQLKYSPCYHQKLIVVSSGNDRLTSSFKKFNRVKVQLLIMIGNINIHVLQIKIELWAPPAVHLLNLIGTLWEF